MFCTYQFISLHPPQKGLSFPSTSHLLNIRFVTQRSKAFTSMASITEGRVYIQLSLLSLSLPPHAALHKLTSFSQHLVAEVLSSLVGNKETKGQKEVSDLDKVICIRYSRDLRSGVPVPLGHTYTCPSSSPVLHYCHHYQWWQSDCLWGHGKGREVIKE